MPDIGVPSRAGGPAFLRPLLDVSREAIETYARSRGLRWVEDESNADETLGRNFVRRRVMPLLRELNPAADANLARSARHLAEADALLGALAAIDAAACTRDGWVRVEALKALGAARARNLLRWIIRANGLETPGSAGLEEILRQVVGARGDASVRFDLGGADLRRYRGGLRVVRPQVDKTEKGEWVWQGERVWRLPELGGVMRFGQATGAGLRAAAARAGRLTLQRRVGGESLRPRAGGPRRAVKKLLQEHGIPPWERESLPLVYCNGELVCLPGVAVEAAWQARAGEAGLQVSWEYAGAAGTKPEGGSGKTG
jgi:tRNA(Ile)-lysidine synthase